MREYILTAAWEASSRDVSIYTRCLTSEDDEPMFLISVPVIYDKKKVRDMFMKYFLPHVNENCVSCHRFYL